MWKTTSSRRTQILSVSQFETLDICLRKWWLERVARLKVDIRPYLIYGDTLHEQLERWYRQEELYQPGWDEELTSEQAHQIRQRITRAEEVGIIRRQEPVPLVELPICLLLGEGFRDDTGIPYACQADTYIDKEGIRRVKVPERLLDGSSLPTGWDELGYLVGYIDICNPPNIFEDHKSTKNKRYAKKRGDVTTSTQMLSYSGRLFYEYPGMDQVLARYNIFLKDPEAAEPVYRVEDYITRRQAAVRWSSLLQRARLMKRLRSIAPRVGAKDDPDRAANYKQVPGKEKDPKLRACNMYRGCQFRDLCFGRCSHVQLTNKLDNLKPVNTTTSTGPKVVRNPKWPNNSRSK